MLHTISRGQNKKFQDRPRTNARGRVRVRGQGQIFEVEAEAEDKILASRTAWPRGLNITASDNAIMLIHALIASRVDYCNSVLFQAAVVHLRPLQSVMNAAARLVVKKRKSDSIRPTPTLRDTPHWLLVRERIDFKLYLLVYKCLHQLAAPYLESMIIPVSALSTRRHLRSAGQGDLTVPRTRTVGVGPRSFSVAGLSGPSLWNTLPSDMKQSSLSIVQFCSQLNSVMFVRSFYA